ncbi:MAG: hypothetical protein WCF44_08850 [Candidatus Methylophosphatis roskildensis]
MFCRQQQDEIAESEDLNPWYKADSPRTMRPTLGINRESELVKKSSRAARVRSEERRCTQCYIEHRGAEIWTRSRFIHKLSVFDEVQVDPREGIGPFEARCRLFAASA